MIDQVVSEKKMFANIGHIQVYSPRSGVNNPQGYDSVIRRMKSLVCLGIDSVCVFSTFALELEDKQGRERWKGMSWSYYTSYAFRQL